MRGSDPWAFIGLMIVLALIWVALAVVVNAVIAIVTAAWFPYAMVSVAAAVVVGLIVYIRSRS